jgi:hypothetical protein
VQAGVAYVPGAPFYCEAPRRNTLRLSFVTVAPPLIDKGLAALGRVLAQALDDACGSTTAKNGYALHGVGAAHGDRP